MDDIESFIVKSQSKPEDALVAFRYYFATIIYEVLPIFPLVAQEDLLELISRRVNDAQGFDIRFAAAVYRLGHRLFENTQRARQLRLSGNSNMDHFQVYYSRNVSLFDPAITRVMRLEELSFWFLWSVCSGIHTLQARVTLYRACKDVARSRQFEEWAEPGSFKELVTLTAALLLLHETSSPDITASLSNFPSFPIPDFDQLAHRMASTDQALSYVGRLRSYQAQHNIWQCNPLERQVPNGGTGHITYVMACLPWYMAYLELVREGKPEDYLVKHNAEMFVLTLIENVYDIQKRQDPFYRMLTMERETNLLRIIAHGARLQLCPLMRIITAYEETLMFIELYMKDYLGKGRMIGYLAELADLRISLGLRAPDTTL
ncbi:hypothetical protein BB8028_0010g00260 [Beauveria bassiana]|uniref:Uncharacterized protein n=1 Tax=Beauveria bassiana TaxID=176275 RepID=A0A2S7YQ04_BEABA|nr:hypothetical protein BB8028_0010g00260 [Beauveria bassiana]